MKHIDYAVGALLGAAAVVLAAHAWYQRTKEA